MWRCCISAAGGVVTVVVVRLFHRRKVMFKTSFTLLNQLETVESTGRANSLQCDYKLCCYSNKMNQVSANKTLSPFTTPPPPSPSVNTALCSPLLPDLITLNPEPCWSQVCAGAFTLWPKSQRLFSFYCTQSQSHMVEMLHLCHELFLSSTFKTCVQIKGLHGWGVGPAVMKHPHKLRPAVRVDGFIFKGETCGWSNKVVTQYNTYIHQGWTSYC